MRERYVNDPDVLLSVEYNTNSSQRRLWARSVEATQRGWMVRLCQTLDTDQDQVRS